MLRKSGIFILMLFLSVLSVAQAPGGVPYGEPDPVEWDLFNVILLIVIPVVVLLVYLWRRRKKKK
jgi:membrane protein DedA with SNARE-associated domain